jgi:hypothetical protein
MKTHQKLSPFRNRVASLSTKYSGKGFLGAKPFHIATS